MEALVRAARDEQWPARIAAVISNRADAAGLAYAADNGIATAVVASREYASRSQFDAALQTVIDGFAPDLVLLAGFMRILTAPFVEHYAGRMLNIHPSLLPQLSRPGDAREGHRLGCGGTWRHRAFCHCRTRSWSDRRASQSAGLAGRYQRQPGSARADPGTPAVSARHTPVYRR